jgi:ABC-type Fe3+ transport system substrate-binding protein
MKNRRFLFSILISALIALLVVTPILLRKQSVLPPKNIKKIIVLTPHGEAIRSEFTIGFQKWAKEKKQLDVEIDWRTPGGTSDIIRFLDERFKADFAEKYPAYRSVLKAFNDPKLKSNASALELEARKAFLSSSVSSGADVLFGGGQFAFQANADKGYLIDTGLLKEKPQWFEGDKPLIPKNLSGEIIYDSKGRYFGACLGVFGIAYNPERLAELQLPAPKSWEDIAGPKWLGTLTLTDPSRSGAAATTFERILQQQMSKHPTNLSLGWISGFSVIKRMVANSRWVTDSASKPTRDTVRGDCVGAMVIDFQAKAESEFAQASMPGADRLRFVVPVGGTSVSSDPIAVFRGAPEPEIAKLFLTFVLSEEGQRLWNQKVGTPGGPVRYALRRYPVRRDLVDSNQAAVRSDPDEDPFAIADGFTFHPEWTGKAFFMISAIVKTTALDARADLIPAWKSIATHGGPEKCPKAWSEMNWLPVAYQDVEAATKTYRESPQAAVTLQKKWSTEASAHYRLAKQLAEAGQ